MATTSRAPTSFGGAGRGRSNHLQPTPMDRPRQMAIKMSVTPFPSAGRDEMLHHWSARPEMKFANADLKVRIVARDPAMLALVLLP